MTNPKPTVVSIIAKAQPLAPEEPLVVAPKSNRDADAIAYAIPGLAADATGDWWSLSAPDAEVADDVDEEWIGSIIGQYRVVGTLGTGGMGRVLMGERADGQFAHKVAIKLVRGDLLSKQVQGRLKIERQILAALDHPNIAKLLDGGTHRGIPYLVMEYVDGQPIDRFCDEHKLTIRDRLILFRTVCSAVHYAHRNLIVHRDLKPSNILVTGDGTPKLLDFGIAKLLDNRQLQHTIAMTHMDVRLLTPDHASPEQVRGDPITTASDTYVLGVLLYELLTGRKPLAMKTGRLSDLENAICERPHVPLAFGLGASEQLPAEFLGEICSRRSTTPNRLQRELRGDLEAIVATALRKEPERRYSSVEQLSDDIRCYLDGRPISARKDSWLYRAKKFAARHPLGVSMSSVGVAALATFSVVMTVQANRIAAERAHAEQIATFLVDMFEQADPERARGSEITVKELLDSASRSIKHELNEQPNTKAELLQTLGTVYDKLGNSTEAEDSLRLALELRRARLDATDARVAQAERRLANVLIEAGKLEEAESLLESALHTQRSEADPLNLAETFRSLARLRLQQERFDDSAALYAECVATLRKVTPMDYRALVGALNDWAVLLDYRKDFFGSEAKYREALSLGEAQLKSDDPLVAQSMHGLAVALAGLNEFAAAAPLFSQSIRAYERVYGRDHSRTAQGLANYGLFLRAAGRLDEAESVLREAVAIRLKIDGPHHVRTAYAQVGLGFAQLDLKRHADAQRIFEQAMESFEGSLPSDHLYIASALTGLGRALIGLERPREAEAALIRAAAIVRERYSATSPALASINAAQGGALLALGRKDEAELLLRDAYPAIVADRGSRDAYVQEVRAWITSLYASMGDASRADQYFASVQQN